MNRLQIIFLFIAFSLFAHGQKIANYVANGSFEVMTDCNMPYFFYKVKNWNSIDSLGLSAQPFSYCNGRVPNQYNTIYQLPRTGKTFVGSVFFCPSPAIGLTRTYIKNRLHEKLQTGVTYCVKFYVNIMGMSSHGNDGFGIYFGDSSIDTITQFQHALPYLTPQIKCPNGTPITDTLGWTGVTGTFVATGNEKYAIIGVFAPDNMVTTASTNSTSSLFYTDSGVDDVSCIEMNLPAYAGPDKSCILGDSVFIGREPDFAIDTGCVWYKLPNMTTAIDTISGLWVKPTTTSTYVVRQELDCSPLKWDTVIVFIDAVGLKDLQWYSDNIKLFPNPTETDLTVTFGNQADISKISIINCLGQTIREEDLRIQKAEFSVSTSDLDKGIYLIQFKTSAGTVTKQFVKN